MITHLLTLQSQLEHIAPVYVSAGRPAAPVGDNCERITIWLDSVEDDNSTDPDSCMVDPRLRIGYEIHGCYRDDAEDLSAKIYREDAARFTNLVESVWTTLVALKDTGTLAGASKCDQVTLTPLLVSPRSGTHVSAVGAIVV